MKYLRYYGVIFDQIFKRGGYVFVLVIITYAPDSLVFD